MTTGATTTSTFDAFFIDEFPRLVTLLTAWSGSRLVAEDLAQESLVQANRQWARVSGLDNPHAWVRRVALNRSKNEWRRRVRERRALDRTHLSVPADDEPQLPNSELWARVRALPAKQRDAIVLRYVDDLPLADIAAVLGCSEGTVKTHLQRGRNALSVASDRDAAARHDSSTEGRSER